MCISGARKICLLFILLLAGSAYGRGFNTSAWPSTNNIILLTNETVTATNVWVKEVTDVFVQTSTTTYIPENPGVMFYAQGPWGSYAGSSRTFTNVYWTRIVANERSIVVTNTWYVEPYVYGTNEFEWVTAAGVTNTVTTVLTTGSTGKQETINLQLADAWGYDTYMLTQERWLAAAGLQDAREEYVASPTIDHPGHPRFYKRSRDTLVNCKSSLKALAGYYADKAQSDGTNYNTYLSETNGAGEYPDSIPVLSWTGMCIVAGAPTNYEAYTPYSSIGGSGPAGITNAYTYSSFTSKDYTYQYIPAIASQMVWVVRAVSATTSSNAAYAIVADTNITRNVGRNMGHGIWQWGDNGFFGDVDKVDEYWVVDNVVPSDGDFSHHTSITNASYYYGWWSSAASNWWVTNVDHTAHSFVDFERGHVGNHISVTNVTTNVGYWGGVSYGVDSVSNWPVLLDVSIDMSIYMKTSSIYGYARDSNNLAIDLANKYGYDATYAHYSYVGGSNIFSSTPNPYWGYRPWAMGFFGDVAIASETRTTDGWWDISAQYYSVMQPGNPEVLVYDWYRNLYLHQDSDSDSSTYSNRWNATPTIEIEHPMVYKWGFSPLLYSSEGVYTGAAYEVDLYYGLTTNVHWDSSYLGFAAWETGEIDPYYDHGVTGHLGLAWTQTNAGDRAAFTNFLWELYEPCYQSNTETQRIGYSLIEDKLLVVRYDVSNGFVYTHLDP